MRVECSDCGAVADPLEPCRCGGLPEFVLGELRLDPIGLRRVVRERRASFEPLFASGVWRWRELLPPIPAAAIVSLAEGNVPLYDSAPGARYAGVDRLAYLHLGMNPTGSFKDLGMTVAISAAKAAGARSVVCASTGNTASSMAAYASRAGLDAYAIVPRGRVSDAKLAQMREYGAQLIEVDGSFDDAFAALSDVRDAAVVNSVNAYRIEGQKCAAFAILEARSWSVPDWIALPGGNLGNISAISKGFREALALGLIDKLPRIALIRAERGVDTTASAIAVGDPKSRSRASRALERFNGIELAIGDDAILDAKAQIGREGIGCEPASAASLAGVRALRQAQGDSVVSAQGDSGDTIAPDADVVAILTGHVLKDARPFEARANALAPQGDKVHAVA
ncbi:MAG TPA: threonine synthase [Candidatus Baltobacteraceae bacterium]|nr:threonine synthase [Candidatus Baltobacteraceae bacterium]